MLAIIAFALFVIAWILRIAGINHGDVLGWQQMALLGLAFLALHAAIGAWPWVRR